MTIYGGFYNETCIFPKWDQIYGSAGRASAVLSNFTDDITLNTFSINQDYLTYFTDVYGIKHLYNESAFDIQFNYLHTFSKPNIISNLNIEEFKNKSIEIEDTSVICYGTLESKPPIINSEYAVFDFQSSKLDDLFNKNNNIKHICFIINYEEAIYLSKEKNLTSIKNYFFKEIDKLDLLVIKDGAFGGFVFDYSSSLKIPIYKTSKIFKIGTGDIFTAVFGYLWINKNSNQYSLNEMIDLASFATAFYSEKYLSQYKIDFTKHFKLNPYPKLFLNKNKPENKVYLAGPFFNISQRWHIEDTKTHLEKLGFDVFSPIHEVGEGNADYIAQEDLKGLDAAHSIFAILNGYDPGTIYEIGYAIAKGKKVIIFSEEKDETHLTMFAGSGCLIFNDMTTALYNLVWEMFSE